jgi:hypothetical protein
MPSVQNVDIWPEPIKTNLFNEWSDLHRKKMIPMKKALSAMLACVLCLSMVACTVDQVLTDINVLIQTAGSIGSAIGAVSPADAAIIAGLSALASKGLTAIQTAYDDYKKSGATTDLEKVQAAITAVQSNLPSELAAAHVYSPAAQAKCAAWVNLIVTSLNVVSAALPQLQSSSKSEKAAAVARLAGNPALTPEALHARWASEVCANDSKCSKLVAVRHHSKFARYATAGLLK